MVYDRFGCDQRSQRRFHHGGEIALGTFRQPQRAPNRHDEAQDFHFALGELIDNQRLDLNTTSHNARSYPNSAIRVLDASGLLLQ